MITFYYLVITFGFCVLLNPPFAGTHRVSILESGDQAENGGSSGSISGDARYVAFTGGPEFANGQSHRFGAVFIRELRSGVIECLSISNDGEFANEASWGSELSSDGRYAAFQSDATNLDNRDENGVGDIFVHDRQMRRTIRASAPLGGRRGGGGRYPRLSADGRHVLFLSRADDLVEGDINNDEDAFVFHVDTETVVRVSVDFQGRQGSAIDVCALSGDGRFAVFQTNNALVPEDGNRERDIYVHDLQTGETTRVSEGVNGEEAPHGYWCGCGDIGDDGRYVSFSSAWDGLAPEDSNGEWDVLVKDLWTGDVELVSTASDGRQGDAGSDHSGLSADGRYVLFRSAAANFPGGGSPDGRQLFRKDRLTGELLYISRSTDGDPANAECNLGGITADGRMMVFNSAATNLVNDDTNDSTDVFLHRLGPVPLGDPTKVRRK